MATILIVDDRSINRQFLVTLLGYGGHRLLEASDGVEALEVVRGERPDLVITDILMPNMDGSEFVSRVHADPAIAHTPVIFYTAAYRTHEIRNLAQSVGVSHVIPKPSEPGAIISAVNELLGLTETPTFSPAPAPPSLEIGPVAFEHRKVDHALTNLITNKYAKYIAQVEEQNLQMPVEHDNLYQVSSELADSVPELQALNLRIGTLIEFGLVLAAEREPQRILEISCHAARDIISAKYAVLGILNEDMKTLRHYCTKGNESKTATCNGSLPSRPCEGVLGKLLKEQHPHRTRNLSGNPEALGFPADHPSIYSFLGIPIITRKRVYGWLYLADKLGADEFSEEDEQLAVTLAVQTALSYENVILYDEIESNSAKLKEEVYEHQQAEEALRKSLDQLSKKNRYEAIINAITGRVHESINLQEVLENTVEVMIQNIDVARHVAIYLVEGEAVLKAHRGYPDWYIDRVRRIPYPKGFAWKTILEGKPMYCADVDQDTVIGPAGREVGTKSYASMPIRTEGKIVGCINICSTQRNIFDEGELKLLEVVARQIGAAIGNAQKAEALRDSERRFAAFMKNLPGMSFMKDIQGRYIYVNETLERVLHMDLRALIGKTDDEIWPAAIASQFKNNDRMVIESGKALQVIQTTPQNDGLRHWLTTKFPILDKDDRPVMIGGVVVDVSEHRKAEDQIREQAALLDVAADAITVRDMEHHILFWSKGAERVYGWRVEEAIGKKVNELLVKESTPAFEESLKVVKDKGQWKGEMQQITKDGREIIVYSSLTLVTDDDGNPKSILAVNTDITEKKQIEAQLLRAQRMESIGTLAGGIAHDLNNVLQPIMMSLQLLRLRFPDKKSHQLLETLETSARRGADLIRQVLSFGRGQEGERTVIQMRYLISEIATILKETLPKSIQIQSNISKDLWTISGDSTQFHQVMMNLCVNARDAMPKGGRLSISAENLFIDEGYTKMHIEAKVGPYIVITVSDTGMGIPPSIIDRVFEPFFTTKEHGKGTGLGLSTTFRIVKDHGGFMNVYSEVGKGTRFNIYIPVIEPTETQKAGEKEVEELHLGHGELILVVDDEISIREITRSTLETHGYRAITACDGAEAVALYAEKRGEIGAVIMDMGMPLMDGPTSIRALRKIDPQVRVIAVSGFRDDSQIAEIIVKDLDIFLSKPYPAQTLLQALHKIFSAA